MIDQIVDEMIAQAPLDCDFWEDLAPYTWEMAQATAEYTSALVYDEGDWAVYYDEYIY